MITYNFQNINTKNILYTIQCKILQELKIIKTDSILIASLIVQDALNNTIEIISFNESAQFIMKQKFKKNSKYSFKSLHAAKNEKFKRTNHRFKLIFQKNQSKLHKINCLEYKIKNQVFVQIKKQDENLGM